MDLKYRVSRFQFGEIDTFLSKQSRLFFHRNFGDNNGELSPIRTNLYRRIFNFFVNTLPCLKVDDHPPYNSWRKSLVTIGGTSLHSSPLLSPVVIVPRRPDRTRRKGLNFSEKETLRGNHFVVLYGTPEVVPVKCASKDSAVWTTFSQDLDIRNFSTLNEKITSYGIFYRSDLRLLWLL